MKLSKHEFTGTGQVFRFTLTQFFKNRANLVSMLILFAFALVSVPVMSLIGGGEPEREQTALQTIYFENRSAYALEAADFAALLAADPYFEGAAVLPGDENRPLGVGEVLARICPETDGSLSIQVSRASNEAASDADVSRVSSMLSLALDTARYAAAGVTAEQMAIVMAGYDVTARTEAEFLAAEAESEDAWDTQYWVQLFYAIIVMMVSIFAVSYIIRAVVEEKASKLVELLMVSVRPLALILGKILAAMVFTLCNIGVMLLGAALSYGVSGLFFDTAAIGDLLGSIGVSLDLMQLGFGTLLAVVVSLLLAYLTFSILAGLSGTGCSTTEEIGGAQTLSMMLILGGYIVCLFATAFDSPVLTYVCSLLPFVSVYCAPVQYLMGGIGFGTLGLAWLLQIAVILLLALFTARIYESLLMHRGSRVTVRQMLTLARQTGGKEVR